MNGIFLCVPVWGDAHVSRLVNYAIPCLLAAGNVPALVSRYRTCLLIHTNAEDEFKLKQHPSVQQIARVCDVEFVLHGRDQREMGQQLHPGHAHGGTMMKMCHNFGIARAWAEGFGFCPLVADQFFANGWGQNILVCLELRKRALGQVGWRLPPSFIDLLDGYRLDGNIIQINAREASAGLLSISQHEPPPPHDAGATVGLTIGATRKSAGFMTRPQHLAIDFIWPKHGPVFCQRSCDNDLADQALDDWDEVMLALSTTAHFTGGIEGLGTSAPSKASAWDEAIAKLSFEEVQSIWLKHACNDWHRHWWQINFWCEDGTLARDEKAPAERYATDIVDRCLGLYRDLLDGRARPEVLAAERLLATWW